MVSPLPHDTVGVTSTHCSPAAEPEFVMAAYPGGVLCNAQPWKFIVIRDEEVKNKLASIAPFGRFIAQAPVGIAVVIDPQGSSHPIEDGAAATQNILLAAHALDLGACWIGSYGSDYEGRAKEILGIPRDRRILSLISLGYAAESPEKGRVELSELVSYDRYTDK